MKEDFEKLVLTGKINRNNLDALSLLADSGYCFHRSWGFGKITQIDTVFGRFIIDFQGKPSHPMDMTFAAASLKAIPANHIYARKSSDIESLRKMAQENPLELVKLVLESFSGQATVDQIQKTLVPDVIKEDWKKWWDRAKRELEKDGHFQIPVKKTEPITYQVKETSLQERLMEEFRAAKGLKAHFTAAGEILRSLSDLNDKKTAVDEVIAMLNTEIGTHQRTQPAVALEAIFVRDDLRKDADDPGTDEITDKTIWLQEINKLTRLLEQLPAAKYRRALVSFKESVPDRWDSVSLSGLNGCSSKLAGEYAHALIVNGKFNLLKETLAKLISQHQVSSDLLLWLARERSDTYADILGPEVFRAMLTAMERDQFNEKRSNKLRDFILADATLLVELIGSADLEIIKDLTRALQLSPCFDDMDKRSLLARIVKSYPAIQSMISGDQARQDATLLVSWESLERRKNEYAELVEKSIPANSKEIAVARSYGDLRENHEYKSAKEMQKILMRRKSELEAQLVAARGTDFANAKTETVAIGTIVETTDLDNQHKETFTILGAWDSDPAKGIISYLTPGAQSLINHKVGEEVEILSDGGKKRLRIDTISAYKKVEGASSSPE